MNSAFIYSESLTRYRLSPNHPYLPARAAQAYKLCEKLGLLSRPGMKVLPPEPVSLEELEKVHETRYLEQLAAANQGEFKEEMLEFGLGTEECPVFPGVFDFFRACVGGTMLAARLVAEQGYAFAFNPLGGFHHAGKDHAEGFCYLNDVALAASSLAERGLKVMVVDIDAHHGNGTQDFFYEDPRVLTMSFHESGETLYPWGGRASEIGEGPGKGYNLNISLPADSDDEIFIWAFDELFPPAFSAFQPDFLLGVMGVDTFSTDPLTHLKMTNNGYEHAVRVIHKLAPRWVALGAGGYDQDNVARGWTLMWAVVHGLDEEDDVAAGLGGVFLGESELGVASLRDPAVRSSGPEKKKILQEVEAQISFLKEKALPLINPQR